MADSRVTWNVAASGTAISTDLDGDTDGARALSAKIDNVVADTESNRWLVLELILESVTFVAPATYDVHVLYSYDSTNFETGDAGTIAADKPLAYSFPIAAGARAVRQLSAAIPLLPYDFKILGTNNCNVTLGSTGGANLIKYAIMGETVQAEA